MEKWVKGLKMPVIIVVVVVVGLFGLASFYLNKINRAVDEESVNVSEEEFESDVNPIGQVINPEDIVWEQGTTEEKNILQDKNIVNIMLIGQDRRPGESRARSDAMIMATINKKDDTVKFTSFMRDLYVRIPGYSDNRLNAAYAFGGIKLLDETIADNFLIHIDGNVEVDFNRFIIMINKIGGIDIVVNDLEAKFLGVGAAGSVRMDGETALKYSRIRYIGNSDYERTQRQREVLVAAYDKVKSMSPTKILGLIDEMLPLVTTDLSNMEIVNLAMRVSGIGVKKIETYRIPADGAYEVAVIRGMQVLVPNLKRNRQQLAKELYGVSDK